MRPDLSKVFHRIKSEPINWEAKYYKAIQEHDEQVIRMLKTEAGLRGTITRLNNEIKKIKK